MGALRRQRWCNQRDHPVSSNTALELDGRFARCRRTRIGSPT